MALKFCLQLTRLRTVNYRYFYKGSQPKVGIRSMSNLTREFEDAKTRLNSLKTDPGNEAKLQLYALFKQATSGKCNTKQPGVFDLVGRAKWSAWNSLGDMSQEAAQKEYVNVVGKYVAAEGGTSASSSDAASVSDYKTIQVTNDGVIRKILLNRPDKKNAINVTMYEEIGRALEEAGKDPSVVVVVITGAGDYYSSGNDLSSFLEVGASSKTPQQIAEEGREILRKFVASFIDFPKILIAVVNGPVVGVAVTVLGLFDAVLATEKATFNTPFSALGQSPEGCSSLLFPLLMGLAKANEMLLFNEKLTAQQALQFNLVTRVYPEQTFQTDAWNYVKQVASNPRNSMLLSKSLIRDRLRPKLHEANLEECKLLAERWLSEECMNALANFMQRRKPKL